MKPFFICRCPGESEIRRYGFDGFDSQGRLCYGPVTIAAWPFEEAPAERLMEVCSATVSQDAYAARAEKLISKLKIDGGKCVIARLICGKFVCFDIDALVHDYFRKFPDMFCFVLYHPSTGFWMGASPELLLQQLSDKVVQTRALAGTMAAESKSSWSDKNLEEHRMVVDDICARIKAADMDLECCTGQAYNLRYGLIDHLCTPITLRSRNAFSFQAIADALHPTPAVAGFPRDCAIEQINHTEWWPRQLYGGLITISEPGASLAYVMLRCVHFDERHWCVYTGSGITADSDASDEYAETQLKAAPLLETLSKFSK